MAKVYVAGKISSHTGHEAKDVATARKLFKEAERVLKLDGNVVLNPAILPDGLTQPEYMDIGAAMLRCCDEIYMLKGWENSLGAMAEYHMARKLGLLIIYQT